MASVLGVRNKVLPVIEATLPHFRRCRKRGRLANICQNFCSGGSHDMQEPQFGFLFDIDGVMVRGRKVLPSARSALRLLTDGHGHFRVPTIFVTNAGNTLRQNKASQLSEWLGIEIQPQQVVMSHSPLKMFTQFFDKHVLVSGQGPVLEIAHNLGFQRVTTIEALRHRFPNLDVVDHRRRKAPPCAFEKYFPRIDALLLFGEPIRWETNLQLLVDVLLTNGQPSQAPQSISKPHIPVLACNMDLFWMAEACMPRYGHGTFMLCLESLYRKITGNELKYTALVGKPSELTYHHSEFVLTQQAREMGIEAPIRTVYCIGDNPETDIYGANLYNRYLRSQLTRRRKKSQQGGGVRETSIRSVADILDWENDYGTVESFESILVFTGVYSSNNDYNPNDGVNFNHRDFLLYPELKKPTHEANNVLEAVKLVYEREGFS
ncbi:haloacid dehalogenase-like hydrolase domain-containing 5 [Lineus longissimus]|uniref:haloacid dehalogenase-like hydrolase domain-containing 5 n=1 Tax=Lineus longissimus TaxID=88925 RepID=UPI002B4C9D83